MEDYKRECVGCGSIIPITKRAHAVYCSTVCGNRVRGKKFEFKHPDRIKINRIKQSMKAENRIYARVKSRAKLNGIQFDLEITDIVIPSVCPVLGIEIVRYQGTGKPAGYFPNSASVDRIKPELGYVKGNIRIVSARANLLKNNATVEELEAVLQDLRDIS